MSKTSSTNEEAASGMLAENRGSDAATVAGNTRTNQVQSDEELPLDEVFTVLKNQRRRYVLRYLRDSDAPVSLGDVAEQIAAWENDKELRQISSSERKRVYVGLYQCHLPKMDDMRVVSFNKPRGIIELDDNASSAYEFLDMAEKTNEPPRQVFSVALSLAGAVVLSLAMFLRSMTTLPVVDVAVSFLVVAFLGYSLVNIGWIRSIGSESETSGED